MTCYPLLSCILTKITSGNKKQLSCLYTAVHFVCIANMLEWFKTNYCDLTIGSVKDKMHTLSTQSFIEVWDLTFF